MRKGLLFLLFCLSFTELTGCSGFQHLAEPFPEQSPAAKMPILVLVAVPAVHFYGNVVRYSTSVQPNSHGEYEILSDTVGTSGIIVSFRTPWPSAIEVRINGISLPKSAIKAGHQYYRIINTTLSQKSPIADWEVEIKPSRPVLMWSMPTFVIEIRNLSMNPNKTDKEKVSSPLVIKVTQPCPDSPQMFTPLGEISPFGFSRRDNPSTNSIEIWKGETHIYSHVRVWQGAREEVFYNQEIPDEAIILEHGFFGHRQIYIIKLGASQNSWKQIGSWVCR